MTALRELQQRFFDLAARVPGARPAGETFESAGALDAGARLSIYADMYLWRQVDALREDFPRLAAVTGDTFFSLAEGYLARHPSTHPSLGRLGDALPAYLAGRARDLGRPDLAGLAELELARNQVFEEADAPVADAGLLQGREDVGALRLSFTPALRLLPLSHDVVGLWSAPGDGEPAPAPRPGLTHVAVWRKGFDVLHAALPETEAAALRLALDGATLAEVCDVFDGVPPALEAVASWFAEQWIAGPLEPEPRLEPAS